MPSALLLSSVRFPYLKPDLAMSKASEKLCAQAFEARRANRLADAHRILTDAVAFCRQTGEQIDLAKALTALGQIERDLHHGDAALPHYEEAAVIYRASGDALKLAHTVRHLADIHRHEGHVSLAEARYCEALDLYRRDERTQPLELANAIRGYAILKIDAGETARAKLLWEEARDLYAAGDVKEGVAESSRRLLMLTQQS
jgi:tetratricopeptide (TPR) repeat protein